MNRVINIPMLLHPLNWLLVWVVLMIAGFAMREIHRGIVNCHGGDNTV